MNHRIVLPAALAVATLGVAFVFVGVLAPAMFNIGIYLIEIGAAGLAIAGILQLIRAPEPA